MFRIFRVHNRADGDVLFRGPALTAEHAYDEYRRMRARKAGIDPAAPTSRDAHERALACMQAQVSEDWLDDSTVYLAVEET